MLEGALTTSLNNECTKSGGNPVIKMVSNTARKETYFEQQFIMSSGIDCKLNATILTRISHREILTWIQQVTDTTPLLMVVGGYSAQRNILLGGNNECIKDEYQKCKKCKTEQERVNDVELISLSKKRNKQCTRAVNAIWGEVQKANFTKWGEGIKWYNEGELYGLTGVFSKDAAIVCGGKHFSGEGSNNCWEWDPELNKWNTNRHKNGIPSMTQKRYRVSSVLNENGDMWVLGGVSQLINNETDINGVRQININHLMTEVYEYLPDGAGRWRTGRPLPAAYRDSGIESHCTIRINTTHVFMGGGFLSSHNLDDYSDCEHYGCTDNNYDYDYGYDYDYEYDDTGKNRKPNNKVAENVEKTNVPHKIGGGVLSDKTWLFDGSTWNERQPMSIPRDRPACSLVYTSTGKINILVAGGCKEYCTGYAPSIRHAEIYDPQNDEWFDVAPLPVPLQSAKMEILEGRPTIIGGWDSRAKQFNEKLYQYFYEENEWKAHPDVEMRMPRTSAAVFQIPSDLVSC